MRDSDLDVELGVSDLTISHPSAATGAVNTAAPLPSGGSSPSGNLCICDGTLADQGAGVRFKSVYVLTQPIIAPATTAPITATQCLQSAWYVNIDKTFPGGGSPIPWSMPPEVQVQVSFGNGGANSLRAVAVLYTMMGTKYVSTQIDSFNAVSGTCTHLVKDVTTLPSHSTLTSSTSNDVSPSGRRGDWYHYRGLSASLGGGGSRLMLNGAPLRASCIEVAAENVFWTRGLTSTRTITRAVGELIVASQPPEDEDDAAGGALFWLPGAPQSCLIIVQQSETTNLRWVLMSENRRSPDLIAVDPSTDVTVQVNFDFNDGDSRTGSFDLWVKIVH